MKYFIVIVLFVVNFIRAEYQPNPFDNSIPENTAWGYLEKYGIPEAERIRKIEEEFLTKQRIVGGSSAGLGDFVYQVSFLTLLHSKSILDGRK